jgi:predicted AAA+ superfamily ATPase
MRPHRSELLTDLEVAYRELYPNSEEQEVYWFFDEIHLVPEWEYFIDRLGRKQKNKIFITGSSAKLASGEIASVLRGRPLVYELFPFSFREILNKYELSVSPPSPRLLPRIKQLSDQYLLHGGFPEVLEVTSQERHRIHSEYYRAIILRDMVERHEPRNPRIVEVVLKELTSQIGLLTSFSRIERRLAATGTKTSLSAILDYFSWAKEAYYLESIELYTESLQKRRVNPVKIYGVDSGLIHSVSASFNENTGRLFENMIYSNIRRHHHEISYYKTKRDYEIDFVVANGKEPLLIQAAYDISDPETRFRELRALEAGMEELKGERSFLITHQQEEEVETGAGIIKIVPAWRFLGEGSLP